MSFKIAPMREVVRMLGGRKKAAVRLRVPKKEIKQWEKENTVPACVQSRVVNELRIAGIGVYEEPVAVLAVRGGLILPTD